jgi:hypothetical protein
VRAGINATRQAADDNQAAFGQFSSELLCPLIPAGGGTTRVDDGNQMAIQKFNVSAHIQEGWWVVNLAQALRVLRLVPSEQADSGGLGLGEFLGGAHGLAGVYHLRDGGGGGGTPIR